MSIGLIILFFLVLMIIFLISIFGSYSKKTKGILYEYYISWPNTIGEVFFSGLSNGALSFFPIILLSIFFFSYIPAPFEVTIGDTIIVENSTEKNFLVGQYDAKYKIKNDDDEVLYYLNFDITTVIPSKGHHVQGENGEAWEVIITDIVKDDKDAFLVGDWIQKTTMPQSESSFTNWKFYFSIWNFVSLILICIAFFYYTGIGVLANIAIFITTAIYMIFAQKNNISIVMVNFEICLILPFICCILKEYFKWTQKKQDREQFFQEKLEFWTDENNCLKAVKRNGHALQFVKEQTEAICLEAVKRNGNALQYVRNQTEAICLEAVKKAGVALQYVHDQTDEICLEAVKNDSNSLQFVKKQTETLCLETVKKNSEALRYVNEQTEKICLEAVKKDGQSLRYVRKQTEAICLEAVKKHFGALKYVKEQTKAICLEAVRNDDDAILYVSNEFFYLFTPLSSKNQ